MTLDKQKHDDSLGDLLARQAILSALNNHAIVSVTDPRGNIVYVNDQFCQISGYSVRELIGGTHQIVNSGTHPREFFAQMWRSIRAGQVWTGDICNRRKDGTLYWVASSITPCLAADGQVEYFMSVRTDVTRLKYAESTIAALHKLTSDFMVAPDLRGVSDQLLGMLLAMTESTAGFVLRATSDSRGGWRFSPLALSGLRWLQGNVDENIHRAVDAGDARGAWLDRAAIPKAATWNFDDPSARAFRQLFFWPEEARTLLLVPIYYGDRLVGVYGLANHPGGYDDSVLQTSQPIAATVGVLMHAYDMSRQQMHTLEDLMVAKDAAERANQAKSQFLSNMSHELRTPLNVMLGFAQMLNLDRVNRLSGQQQDNVREIITAGQHLLGLITDVLDLAKIESGRLNLVIAPMRLNILVEQCIHFIAPLAAERKVSVDCESAIDANIAVEADPMRLRQVLLNLLTNAVKYNREHGDVRISIAELSERSLRLAVTDTGPGIATEKLPELFLPFSRLGRERTDDDGTGVGLAISKQLVEMMGGKIGVHSTEGQGSTFWVQLRRCRSPSVAGATSMGDSTDDGLAPKKSVVVLYIEDNPSNMKLVESILRQRGNVTFLSAISAEAGLTIAYDAHPDIILVDINLPDADGFHVLRELQCRGIDKNSNVVAISADATTETIQKGLAAGFFRYITKPIDVVKLLEVVDLCLVEAPAKVAAVSAASSRDDYDV